MIRESLMKWSMFVLLCTILFSATAAAQDPPPFEGKHRERLEQLRRVKLIEALDLNEEQAVRLSVREKEFRTKQKEAADRREGLLDELRDMIEDGADDASLRAHMTKIDDAGAQMLRQKHEFLLSLDDFLSIQQIAKIVLFEREFAGQVRRLLENARRPQRR